MTPQSNFMIAAPVAEGQLDELRRLLRAMNRPNVPAHADPNNELVPFGLFSQLHFARFTIIEARTAHEIREFGVEPRPWPLTLALIGDIDGDRDSFLVDLVEKAGPGLEKIFSQCEGFPQQPGKLLQWMREHNVEPAANYVNWIGRTVRQIHEEAALHASLTEYLPKIIAEIGAENTRQLRQRLLSHVEMEKHEGRLTLTPPEPTPGDWKIRNLAHMIAIPLILLLLSPLFVVIAPFFALRFRMLERSDPELFIRPERDYVEELSAQEDLDVSNQYNVFGDVKPGLFRRLTFQFVLLLTDYLARHVFNRGFLTRIKTIHFARWFFVDDGHRVFFVSNYDGSHESYMDDFINKVGWGLNLTFGNGVGYPTTRWWLKEGAKRELPFKYTQRRHQLPSEVWYKAYPDLSAVDLARNSRIREGVEVRQSSEAGIREWLQLI